MISQSMNRYIFFLTFLVVFSCKTNTYQHETGIEFERVADSAPGEDQDVLAMIEPYKLEMDAQMNKVIAQLDVDLLKQRPQGTMGNWVVDMMHDELVESYNIELDFSAQNYGGLRIPSVSAGPLTIGKVYEVMPFDNKVSILRTKGTVVKQFLDHIAKAGGWPLSYNVSYTISEDGASDVMINDQALDLTKDYTFAVPDYVASGGSDCQFLRGESREDLDVYIRDLYLGHIMAETAKGLTQSAVIDQRVKVANHE